MFECLDATIVDYLLKFAKKCDLNHWCTAHFQRKMHLMTVIRTVCHHLFGCICKQIIDCTLQIIFEIQLFLIRLHSRSIHRHISFWIYFETRSLIRYQYRNSFYPYMKCCFFSILSIVSMLRKAGRQVKRDCGKSNGKNVLNKNYRTERADNWKEWNECRCFCYCCWLFYNIISTMDYLCKLIESNKNTNIVNRCLPLNYREISWMHSSSIWALEQNVKCRRKK